MIRSCAPVLLTFITDIIFVLADMLLKVREDSVKDILACNSGRIVQPGWPWKGEGRIVSHPDDMHMCHQRERSWLDAVGFFQWNCNLRLSKDDTTRRTPN